MIFTSAFWLVASLLASLVDGKTVAIPKLLPAITGFFVEQIDPGMILCQLLVLGLVALPALFFAEGLQKEIRREVIRLYYTMSAAAGALSVVAHHWLAAGSFYLLGVFVPWIMIWSKPKFLKLD